MGLHQGGQSQVVADGQIPLQGFRVQQGADEQHAVRPHESRLVELVGVHREVLAEHGGIHRPPNLPKNPVGAQKPLGFCQAGDGVRPGAFIVPCNVQIGKFFRDDPLGGGGLFYLAEKRELRLCQGGLKALPPPPPQGAALGLEHVQAVLRLVRRHPLPGVGGQLV